jgi:hypothetical protein
LQAPFDAPQNLWRLLVNRMVGLHLSCGFCPQLSAQVSVVV